MDCRGGGGCAQVLYSPPGKASTPGDRSQRPIHLCIPFSLTTAPKTHQTDTCTKHAQHTHPTHTDTHTPQTDTYTHIHMSTVTQTQPILTHTCMCVHARVSTYKSHLHTCTYSHIYTVIHTHAYTIYESHALAPHSHMHASTAHTHMCTHTCSHTMQPPLHAPRARHVAGVLSGLTGAMKRCVWRLCVRRCFFSINFPVICHRLPGVHCVCVCSALNSCASELENYPSVSHDCI